MSDEKQGGAAGVDAEPRGGRPEGDDHGRDMVTITVNNKPVEIHRGRESVGEIKRLGNVPAADELAEVMPGEPLKPLADDGSEVIKGGEEFISYPKDSGSSFAAPRD